jgi:hypothetical protein
MGLADRGHFEHVALNGPACLALLKRVDWARILVSVHCLPAALPAYIHVSKSAVLIASVEASVNEAARRRDVLAVHLDGADDDGSTWSVQITGSALLGGAEALPPDARSSRFGRAIDDGAHLVVVPMTVVTGERVNWTTAP